MTLRDASISSGYISAEDFGRIVVPANMVGNLIRDLSTLSPYPICKQVSNFAIRNPALVLLDYDLSRSKK